jgi:hypothetical protein
MSLRSIADYQAWAQPPPEVALAVVGADDGSAGADVGSQLAEPRFANTVPGPLAESPIAKQFPEDDFATMTTVVVERTSTETVFAVVEVVALNVRLGSAAVRPVTSAALDAP